MKLHRFYVPETDLIHDFWLKDPRLFHQWARVLRFEVGREVVLFNDVREERLYQITKIGTEAVHVNLVTEMAPKFPKREMYLCFSLLKKDKNDWVLQKATELGVSHFVPMLADRTEKTGFDVERAQKIVIEAAEQCGRTDIPNMREPVGLKHVLAELCDKTQVFVAEESSSAQSQPFVSDIPIAVLVGPEGGWTDAEKQFFIDNEIKHLSLSDFTLRAETACVTAVAIVGAA